MSEPLHLLLDAAANREASDLHLAAGEMPWLRVAGEMTPLAMDTGPLTAVQIQAMLVAAMSPADRSRWESAGARSIDFAYAVPSLGRFRINASHTLTGVAAVVRRIPHEIPTAEALGLPEVVTRLAALPAGLVFVTGASGEGKSTTLAALVDTINRTREGHVLTIEDPIEYAHAPRRCRITQREVGVHTETFTRALEDAVRQDPDVIVVGRGADGGDAPAHPGGRGDGTSRDGVAAHHQCGVGDHPDGGDGGDGASGAGARATRGGAPRGGDAAAGADRGRAAGGSVRGSGEHAGSRREHRVREHDGHPLRDGGAAGRDADTGAIAGNTRGLRDDHVIPYRKIDCAFDRSFDSPAADLPQNNAQSWDGFGIRGREGSRE
ncbi:MAG: pilT [Gemmatimonadetes bacterium]|nr:pilT [Gemmatimonadota bacterium]